VTNTREQSERLSDLLDRLRASDAEADLSAMAAPPPPRRSGGSGSAPPAAHACDHLVHAFLSYDAPRPRADASYLRVAEAVVDWNELRVCHETEIAALLDPEDVLASWRARRLRRVLQSVYEAWNTLDLAPVTALNKREARAALDGLDGMLPFVAADVTVRVLGGHAVPVDDLTRRLLVEEGIVDADRDASAVQSWLERRIRTADMPETYFRLRAWGARRCTEIGLEPRIPEQDAVDESATEDADDAAGRETPSRASAPTPSGSGAKGKSRSRGGTKSARTRTSGTKDAGDASGRES